MFVLHRFVPEKHKTWVEAFNYSTGFN